MSTEELESVLQELLPHTTKLACNAHGSIVLERFLECMDEEMQEIIVGTLAGQVSAPNLALFCLFLLFYTISEQKIAMTPPESSS